MASPSNLIKMLELIAFGLIGGIFYSYALMIESPYRWHVFGVCVIGVLVIIFARKKIKAKM